MTGEGAGMTEGASGAVRGSFPGGRFGVGVCIWSGRLWVFDVVRWCSAGGGGLGRCAVLGEIPVAGRGYDGSFCASAEVRTGPKRWSGYKRGANSC